MAEGLDTCGDEEWLPRKIYLVDQSPRLVETWRAAFAVFQEVEVLAGDYFQRPADALVSPANSFGIMDGGLDGAIRQRFGDSIQVKVQNVILEKYHGELPVGCAEIVATDEPAWKYLIAAPTMRVPESVSGSLNAYLAFRAILLAIENLNKRCGRLEIASLVCSGLATGVGGMSAERCARQMRLAYDTMLAQPLNRRFESIWQLHRELRQS